MTDTPTAPPCRHPDFDAQVEVDLIGEEDEANPQPGTPRAYVANLRVQCTGCGEPFKFVGLPVGLSFYGPMTSVDATTLQAPMIPASQAEQIEGLAGFHLGQFVPLTGGTLDLGGMAPEAAAAFAAEVHRQDPSVVVRYEGQDLPRGSDD